MDLIFLQDSNLLESLQGELHQSPEDLLTELEDALESGELTVDEVILYVKDLNQRSH